MKINYFDVSNLWKLQGAPLGKSEVFVYVVSRGASEIVNYN